MNVPQSKKEILPEAQWKSTVKYITGSETSHTDVRSKPECYKKDNLDIQQHTIDPSVLTMEKPTSSSSIPQDPSKHCPEEITEFIADLTLTQRSVLNWKTFYNILLAKHGPFLKNHMVHPEFPFLTIFHIHDLFSLPKEALCFFWYLFETHTIAITFNACKLFTYLFQCQFEQVSKESKHLFTLFQWFLPAHQWVQKLHVSQKTYVVIFFKRPCSFLPAAAVGGEQSMVYHFPTTFIHTWHDINPSNRYFEIQHAQQLQELRHALINANRVVQNSIPAAVLEGREIWPERHPDVVLWDETLRQWSSTHLAKDISSSEDDFDLDDNPDSYYYLGDDTDYDPYEDDPSHPDSRW